VAWGTGQGEGEQSSLKQRGSSGGVVVALAVVFPVCGSAPVYLVGQAQVLGHREQKGHEGKVFPRRESEGGWSLPERRRWRRHF
jgi:hypothetical protein